MEKIVDSIVKKIKKQINFTPKLAIILGSGLGNFASLIKNAVEIPYKNLKGIPVSTVKGHTGKFIFGEVEGVNIVAMQGRCHLYEGYSVKQVTLPIYVFKKLGVEALIVTNASGAVNTSFQAGDLMIMNDHINLTCQNPLIGGQIIPTNEQFIDMTNAYDKDYIKKLNSIGEKNNFNLKNGTYLQLLGPSYETPAEVRMARVLGADAVGMSTVIEVIAATQIGLKTAGISAISNAAAGVTSEVVSHENVLKVMKQSEIKFTTLILEFIKSFR